jgi:hypothetical protein
MEAAMAKSIEKWKSEFPVMPEEPGAPYQPGYQSGTKMLLESPSNSTFDSAELNEFMEMLRADKWTWERWRGVSQMKASQALALHHHLDPDRMGFGDETSAYFKRILRRTNHWTGPLYAFQKDLEWQRYQIAWGELSCVKINTRDLNSSIVDMDHYRWFISSLDAFEPPVPVPALDVTSGGPPPWLGSHCTPLMRVFVEAAALYRTVAEGGSYVPGVHETAPGVKKFIASKTVSGKPVSDKVAAAIATILWPEELPKGRPPKARKLVPILPTKRRTRALYED